MDVTGLSGLTVWQVHLDRPGDLSPWWRVLSEPERERATRLACPRAQRRFVVAHAALRAILGRLCGVRAALLELRTEPAGRPYLALPSGRPPLDFNLSHSGEWALVAVAPARWRVGVDIEQISPDLDCLAMARHLYQPAEVTRLAAASADARRTEYYMLWTAKEAYVKALGTGLAGLRDVAVHRAGSATTGAVRSPAAPAAAWPVRWLRVAPGYAAATVHTRATPVTAHLAETHTDR